MADLFFYGSTDTDLTSISGSVAGCISIMIDNPVCSLNSLRALLCQSARIEVFC